MTTVQYKNLTITKQDTDTIIVSENGEEKRPTIAYLRDIAKELNVSNVNRNGNFYNTRQLGVEVIRAIYA